MGACCAKLDDWYGRPMEDHAEEEEEEEVDEEDDLQDGAAGARIRLQGPSSFTSMYTHQGQKGTNQDAMTIWEDFTGEEEMFFCGMFDGHGPHGHLVARHVRDSLPSKLSEALTFWQLNHGIESDAKNSLSNGHSRNLPFATWEASFLRSFNETDEELGMESSIDSFCSGTTAVTVIKQGSNLLIANLGDSRAVLCTRGDDNQLLPIQITVDLKPDIPSEAERIRQREGRVFAIAEDPDVYRVWMPDIHCPGLAMSRAFGDFCLKDYGLTSIPELSYRRLTKNDEFVVLATDGVWDALTNNEVIRIVASAKKRSMAAKLVVKHAVRAWRYKYPSSSVDDCSAICLFLKNEPATLTEIESEVVPEDVNRPQLRTSASVRCGEDTDQFVNRKGVVLDSKRDRSALEGVGRTNFLGDILRSADSLSLPKRLVSTVVT